MDTVPIVAHRKFFIGGLSWTTTEESVKQFFEDLGFLVEKTQIMRNKSSGRSRGFGFIIFFENELVDEIQPSYLLDGRQIEVKFAVPKEEMGAKTKKIFVGGLPVTLGETAFHAHFQEYGPIVEAQIMKDRKNSRSRGFGFIRFQSEDSVEEVLKHQHIVMGKVVEVKKALPKHALSSMNQDELTMCDDASTEDGGSLPGSLPQSPKPRSPALPETGPTIGTPKSNSLPGTPPSEPLSGGVQLNHIPSFTLRGSNPIYFPRPLARTSEAPDAPFIFLNSPNYYFSSPLISPAQDAQDEDPESSLSESFNEMSLNPPMRQSRSPFISVGQGRVSPSSSNTCSSPSPHGRPISPSPQQQRSKNSSSPGPPGLKASSPLFSSAPSPVLNQSHQTSAVTKRLVSSEPQIPGSPGRSTNAWGGKPPNHLLSYPNSAVSSPSRDRVSVSPSPDPRKPVQTEFLDQKEKERDDDDVDRMLTMASESSLFHTSVDETVFGPVRLEKYHPSPDEVDDDVVIRSFELGKPSRGTQHPR